MSKIIDFDAIKKAETLPLDPAEPRFVLSKSGVFYIGKKIDQQTGIITDLPPLWLCDQLEIMGRGCTDGGQHYRILKWHSRGNGMVQTHALPLAMIGEKAGWAILKGNGLALATSRRALEHLATWLQTEGVDTMYHVTECGGWNKGAYVLPSGEIIGKPTMPLFYIGDQNNAKTYRQQGNAESWRDNVARLASGNSRPMLSIGCGFAAPLLHLIDLESGGFHLYGDSGDGKTTSAKVGGSVWGKPTEQILNWDSTALALTNAAAARNDGLMMLDEVGQGNPDAVSMSAYRLFNGVGKMQGAKEGGNRAVLNWRILAFSTGEKPLYEFLSSGGKTMQAGQEVRLPSIAADAGAGYGAFENLHGHSTAGQFAEALDDAYLQHYGSVGRVFITAIASDLPSISIRLRTAVNQWRNALPPEASGQTRRITARFALVAEALEIATELGLTGWQLKEGKAAIRRCFDEWLAQNGVGKREDENLLNQAEAFFNSEGFSRFIDLLKAGDDREEIQIHKCAGYRKRDVNGSIFFLVFPHVFINEIAKGFEKSKASEVLNKHGMIMKPNEKGWTAKHRTPDFPDARRFYRFNKTARHEIE
jgi:putative DNA primase/helicase